jgi:uncharacterized protein (TIGR02246 family)
VSTAVSDETAVRNLISSYAHAADDGDGEALAELFVDGGDGIQSLGLSIQGTDKLAALIKGIYDANLKHLQLNSVINIEGDTASAVSDLMVQAVLPDAGWQTIAQGRYHDDMVRKGGRWQFVKREIIWHRATPSEVAGQLRELMAGGV